MSRRPLSPTGLMFCLVLACSPQSPGGDAGPVDAATASDAGPAPSDGGPTGSALPLAALTREVAVATCDALFRCCEGSADLATYFSFVAKKDPGTPENPGKYAAVIPRVPPNASLDAAACPDLLVDIFALSGLGPWVAAAEAGRVSYVETEARACLRALEDAACGEPVRDALYDGTCFGLGAPEGGAFQRRAFARVAAPGTACQPIVDGIGALYYGTCDPERAFCCVPGASSGCGFPSEGAEGVCQAVAEVDATCSNFNPVQLCATGIECIPGAGPDDNDACLAPETAPLSLGAACYDANAFRLKGVCGDDAYCDILASDLCVARKSDGAACGGEDECLSGACEGGSCGTSTHCVGSP